MPNQVDEQLRLTEALCLEQEALRQVHALIGKLEEEDPYRKILESHVGRLEHAVRHLEALMQGPLHWLDGR
jgi:hypothetical protein